MRAAACPFGRHFRPGAAERRGRYLLLLRLVDQVFQDSARGFREGSVDKRLGPVPLGHGVRRFWQFGPLEMPVTFSAEADPRGFNFLTIEGPSERFGRDPLPPSFLLDLLLLDRPTGQF